MGKGAEICSLLGGLGGEGSVTHPALGAEDLFQGGAGEIWRAGAGRCVHRHKCTQAHTEPRCPRLPHTENPGVRDTQPRPQMPIGAAGTQMCTALPPALHPATGPWGSSVYRGELPRPPKNPGVPVTTPPLPRIPMQTGSFASHLHPTLKSLCTRQAAALPTLGTQGPTVASQPTQAPHLPHL